MPLSWSRSRGLHPSCAVHFALFNLQGTKVSCTTPIRISSFIWIFRAWFVFKELRIHNRQNAQRIWVIFLLRICPINQWNKHINYVVSSNGDREKVEVKTLNKDNRERFSRKGDPGESRGDGDVQWCLGGKVKSREGKKNIRFFRQKSNSFVSLVTDLLYKTRCDRWTAAANRLDMEERQQSTHL